jgi:3-hydroxyanthranilate 3,4-dioxygenase
MFVGGPNTREDFHLEEGAEFFYQLRGEMRLPTVQKGGMRKEVVIPAGHVFLLPSRVPHSPQRPEKGSLGLVVERRRESGEKDALRFYRDPATCRERLFERYFACRDLGKDLKPIIDLFKASSEFQTRAPGPGALPETREIVEADIDVPEPFDLLGWVAAHGADLARPGSSVSLFGAEHPDDEFVIQIEGASSASQLRRAPLPDQETLLVQLQGSSVLNLDEPEASGVTAGATTGVAAAGAAAGAARRVTRSSSTASTAAASLVSEQQGARKKAKTRVSHTLAETSCFVVGAGRSFSMERDAGSVCMVVTQAKGPRSSRLILLELVD